MERSRLLEVAQLRIVFDGKPEPVVSDLNFRIGAGETLAIVGESGSGKSLIASALLGLLPKNAGWSGNINLRQASESVSINGVGSIAAPGSFAAIRGKAIGIISQTCGNALNPVMKVGSQLMEALRRNAHMTASDARRAAMDWLVKVKIAAPETIYHKYPHELTAGQKLRVTVATAMSSMPSLLVADEPTAALDVIEQAEIIRIIKELQADTNTALLFLTRDLALAAHFADNILHLRNGQAVAYGPTRDVMGAPGHPYTRAWLAYRPSGARKGKRLPAEADFASAGEHSNKHNDQKDALIAPARSSVRPKEEALLKVRHLRVWFPIETDWLGTPVHFLRAVEDVSFDLHSGEVLGIVGESGSGKSTICRALTGLQTIESGQMHFDGGDLVHLTRAERRKIHDMQAIFQDSFSSLSPRLTIADSIMEPLRVRRIVPRRELRTEALRVLELVQLTADVLNRYPYQLSPGQRQQVSIARAIALRPKLLILDEGLNSLDVNMQAHILNLIRDLQGELKLSILFISHDLNMVHYIADRIIVMEAGKIIERGAADQVFRHPQQDGTRRLISAIF